ncbi:GIY-YIG nuclease family protein [Pedobacter frigiditerrae]|uniref:GIY-YIG nuclease family protein n=1 Tax=Pedobacter frigiditerrae TaxID=2530452 RepID=UPI00292F65D7|nr:GIY-YIG nuclease family protein [Pedobacter frigiditerrae]
MERGGCVYIMTNYNKTVLYIGVTSDLFSRILEHKSGKYPDSFSARYQLKYCVYYESIFTIEEAIGREKQIKKWRREKKDDLINSINPDWKDLWEVIKEW